MAVGSGRNVSRDLNDVSLTASCINMRVVIYLLEDVPV